MRPPTESAGVPTPPPGQEPEPRGPTPGKPAAAADETRSPDPRQEAQQRAHRFFRYAGMGYFALLALVPVILAWQGVLWQGLREMANLAIRLLLLAPLVVLAVGLYRLVVTLLRRDRPGRQG